MVPQKADPNKCFLCYDCGIWIWIWLSVCVCVHACMHAVWLHDNGKEFGAWMPFWFERLFWDF